MDLLGSDRIQVIPSGSARIRWGAEKYWTMLQQQMIPLPTWGPKLKPAYIKCIQHTSNVWLQFHHSTSSKFHLRIWIWWLDESPLMPFNLCYHFLHQRRTQLSIPPLVMNNLPFYIIDRLFGRWGNISTPYPKSILVVSVWYFQCFLLFYDSEVFMIDSTCLTMNS